MPRDRNPDRRSATRSVEPGSRKIRAIAFVTYPGMTLLDLVGPITTFFGLTRGLVMPSRHYRAVCVGAGNAPTQTDTPMALIPEETYDEVADPFAIIVPGGGMAALEAMGDDTLIDYVRSAGQGAQVVGSVSTGTFILAAAGLLDDRQVTTHPAYAPLLRKLGANYVRSNWVEDGRLISAAGVSGGIDMALHLVARLQDEPAARDIQLVIEYDPHPPFGGLGHNAREAQLEAMPPEHRARLSRALAGRPDLRHALLG